MRSTPELKAAAEARAAELGQSMTVFVERALEKALATDGGGGSPGVSQAAVPASSQVSVPPVKEPRRW